MSTDVICMTAYQKQYSHLPKLKHSIHLKHHKIWFMTLLFLVVSCHFCLYHPSTGSIFSRYYYLFTPLNPSISLVSIPYLHNHSLNSLSYVLRRLISSSPLPCDLRKYNIRVEDIMVRDVRYITLNCTYRDLHNVLLAGHLKTLALVESAGETHSHTYTHGVRSLLSHFTFSNCG